MPQDDRPARGPQRRSDSARPANTRRGGDRRPWPTAPTTTRVSPAKPGPTRTRTRSRDFAQTPTPATVWTSGAAPIDLDTTWPAPIVSTIVTAFSKPGARVVLLPWPTPKPNSGSRSRLGVVDADGTIRRAPETDPDDDLADALATVDRLDRTGRVVRVPVDAEVTGPASRPFWADLIGTPERTPGTASVPSTSDIGSATFEAVGMAAADTDLVITSMRPDECGGPASDLVALVAARLLRAGGILAVLTHCDWSQGELLDPTGIVVAAAQNADLLYLQHIVALHVPVRDGRLAVEALADEDSARARHRAAVRGLPVPHRRVQSDVLAFCRPHQHPPLEANAEEQAVIGGTLQ